ncbi:hypothetical protein SCUCBS95973_001204 [Sporothrix curviconia]|uniref:glucarate dehydratase n=1 Tax=Sporothrix curviconia TaxID=1260050 RepID=A0ABP0AWQ1_9PEZI
MARGIIKDIVITPVAFHDMPLLNSVGVHEPYALRSIIEVVTDEEYGLGESYGDAVHIARLQKAAKALVGLSVYDTNTMELRCIAALDEDTATGGDGMAGLVTTASAADKVFSPFEVACLNIQGKLAGVPVYQLLGGRVRDTVPFSADLVKQARQIIDEYGFTAIKLKGGVFQSDEEIAGVRALREAFPGVPLRIDPNAAWTVETSQRVARALDGVLEYLEDPTPDIAGMAAVAKTASMPLTTKPSWPSRTCRLVLSDHHFWGGLRKSQVLAGICATWGMSLSMHSNSHLGISLAAMTHLAAATRNIDYACDTHWPWKRKDEDVVVDGALTWKDGGVQVPTKPGLGVELDRERLAKLHQQYLDCGLTKRDDTAYIQKFHPEYSNKLPRW